MRVDIHLKFNRSSINIGKCHIRFSQFSKNLPLVVVCSQYKNYYGTSITNAHEQIAKTVFELVASRKIENLNFNFDLKINKTWCKDANLLDKFLVKLFPEKYGPRFIDETLDIGHIFKNIVWVEHYPAHWNNGLSERVLHIVQQTNTGEVSWRAYSDDVFFDQTGFRCEELLLTHIDLDLHKIEPETKQLYQSATVLQKHPGFEIIRWTEDLVSTLPALLSSNRANKGKETNEDLQESAIHEEIEEFFAIKFPSRKLFERDYDFSKIIGIQGRGRQKNLDFAIFSPDGVNLDSVLEVKRTSSKTNNLSSELFKDIARLLMLSNELNCICFLLLCGNTIVIQNTLIKMENFLSRHLHPSFMDCYFLASDCKLSDEYKGFLEKFHIAEGASRLQGIKTYGANGVFLWQIDAKDYNLVTNPTYEYNIAAYGSSKR